MACTRELGVDPGESRIPPGAGGAHAGPMTAMSEHPSLRMHVTTDQRDRAEDFLKEAYADGRISESEFDTRIGQVLGADNRKELNEAFFTG